MAIPRGRFLCDFRNKDIAQAEKIIQRWNGKAIKNGYGVYTWEQADVNYVTLPLVLSTTGNLWFNFYASHKLYVTLGPTDYWARFPSQTTQFNIDPYSENTPVGWSWAWDPSGYWTYYSEGGPGFIYQSFGSNTYTINPFSHCDPLRYGTTALIMSKGTHIATGKASCIILNAPFDTSQSWDSFHFWIWNPEINNWITGNIKGIKQTLTDSSHILITPVEMNGYSFPEIKFADATSNPAFGLYCGADQIKEYKYCIKKVTLSGTTYYVPITHSNKTVILLTKKPDDITIDH